MAITFMALFSAVISERICAHAGTILTLPLILLGIGSVVDWGASERRHAGDLRFYVVVQFFTILCIPIILNRFPKRYSHSLVLLQSVGWYVLAKVCEALDGPILTLFHVSGHTFKHIFAGVSIYWIFVYLNKRTIV